MNKKIALFCASSLLGSGLDEFFKRLDMLAERLLSGLCRNVTRVGFLADELLLDRDVILRLERLGVARQVAVGHAEQFLERIEIGRIVHHQHAHDTEPDPVVESLVDILDDILQLPDINYCWARSYLEYMMLP